MSLFVVATPIGNPEDLTERARRIISECDLVIGEEKKPVDLLLRKIGQPQKPYELLNEHSKPEEVRQLAELCKTKKVALISDCGTPGFCDPGADLVALCRKADVEIHPLPGPSSLMALLSVCGRRLDQFHFEGFLPQEKEARASRLKRVLTWKIPVIVMDTPYRLGKLLSEISAESPTRHLFLGLDLTQATESLHEGPAARLSESLKDKKAEFVMIVYP